MAQRPVYRRASDEDPLGGYVGKGGEQPLGTSDPDPMVEVETARLGRVASARGEDKGQKVKFVYVRTLAYENHWFYSLPYTAGQEAIFEMAKDLNFPKIPEVLILIPTTAAQIELDDTIRAQTPTISANASSSWPVHVKEIHVKAAVAGTLQAFGFW